MFVRTKIFLLVALAALVGLSLIGLPSASAQEQPAKQEQLVKVGLYDFDRIAEQLKGLPGKKQKKEKQKVKRTTEERKKADPIQGPQGQEIRAKIQEINKELQKKELSKAEREKREAEVTKLRKKLTNLRFGEEKKEQDKEARKELEKQVREAATKLARDQGFVFLLDKSYWNQGPHKSAIIFGQVTDVTDEIIKRLKAKEGSAGAEPQKQAATNP